MRLLLNQNININKLKVYCSNVYQQTTAIDFDYFDQNRCEKFE